MIFTVTLNPAVDKTLLIPGFAVDRVNRVALAVTDPGGKGINVSKSVQALGGESVCLGILGGETGEYIASALTKMELQHDFVMTDNPTRTNIKIVDLQQKTNTDINEQGAPVEQQWLDAVWEKLHIRTKPGDTVIFAGKNPPGTPDHLLADWTKALAEKGVCVCVDTVGEPMKQAILQHPNVIKPNGEELEALLGMSLSTDEEILHAAKKLNAMGIDLVAVSLGAEGAIFSAKEKALRVRVPKVTVVSTVGAGDSMMAAIAYGKSQGMPLEEIARYAAAVSAATVQVEGSKPAQLGQIVPLMEQIKVEYM